MPEDHWHVNSQIDMNSFVEAAVYVPPPDAILSNLINAFSDMRNNKSTTRPYLGLVHDVN